MQSLLSLYGNFVDLTNAWFSHTTAPGPKPEALHWEAAILPMLSGLTSVDLGGKTDHGRCGKRRGDAAKSFQPSAERVGRRGPAGTDGPETTRVRHSHVRRPELRRAAAALRRSVRGFARAAIQRAAHIVGIERRHDCRARARVRKAAERAAKMSALSRRPRQAWSSTTQSLRVFFEQRRRVTPSPKFATRLRAKKELIKNLLSRSARIPGSS